MDQDEEADQKEVRTRNIEEQLGAKNLEKRELRSRRCAVGCERCKQLASDLELAKIKAMNLREELAQEQALVKKLCEDEPQNESRTCRHCRERFTTGEDSPNQYCVSCQALMS